MTSHHFSQHVKSGPRHSTTIDTTTYCPPNRLRQRPAHPRPPIGIDSQRRSITTAPKRRPPHTSRPARQHADADDSHATTRTDHGANHRRRHLPASDFPYKNYGTFFRDNYGENSNIISSEDGGILIDIGCAPYGVALVKVDSIPAEKRCKVIVSANGKSYQYDILARGKYLGIPLQLGEGSYTITVYEQVSGTSYTREIGPHLRRQPGVQPETVHGSVDHERFFPRFGLCRRKPTACAAASATATGRVDAVYRWIVANIDYDRDLAGSITSGEVTTYVPDPEKTYTTRKGICFDYASLMCAMLRSQGIPTRLVVGQTPLGYHAWNEVYFAGTGWVVVASFSWQEIDGSGWVMFDTTFAAGGMTPESIQGTTHTKQKTY